MMVALQGARWSLEILGFFGESVKLNVKPIA